MSWKTSTNRCAGDTKAGTLIGKDRYGNKFYENLEEELPRLSFTAMTRLTF